MNHRPIAARVFGWLAFLTAVLAGLRAFVPVQGHFLGATGSCGNVIAWWSGADRHAGLLMMAVCTGPLGSAASVAEVLFAVAAVLAVASWSLRRPVGPPTTHQGPPFPPPRASDRTARDEDLGRHD